jgi:excisionase family DNA binding protein
MIAIRQEGRGARLSAIVTAPGRVTLDWTADMPAARLLTVPEVAEEFQVTAQTIRNWIDQGILPAVRVGRGYRMRREDVDELMTRASASSASLATRRDVWAPMSTSLPRREASERARSIWEGASAIPLPRRA